MYTYEIKYTFDIYDGPKPPPKDVPGVRIVKSTIVVTPHYFTLFFVLLVDTEVLYRLVQYVVLANMFLLLVLMVH